MNVTLKNLFNLFLNSLISYTSSYLLILFFSQMITFFSAKVSGIPVNLENYKVAFSISDNSSLWTQNSVVAIYLTSPLLVLLLGFAFRFFKSYLDTHNSSINLFLTWSYAHSMNMFFGGLIVGIPLVKGLGYVPAWLYFPFYIQVLIVILSSIILILNSFVLSKYFLSLSFNDYYLKNNASQLSFKIIVSVFPYFMINIIFLILKIPENSLYELLLKATMLIQFIGVIPFTHLSLNIQTEDSDIKFSRKMLLLLLITSFLVIFIKMIFQK